MDYQKLSKTRLIEELQRLQSAQGAEQALENEQRLRQELEVHQVELEMQNRELNEKQQELEAACDKYADLYDFAPVGYLTLDKHGTICEVNLTATRFLEHNRLQMLGKPFVAYLGQGYGKPFRNSLRRALEFGEEQSIDLQLKRKDNVGIDVKLQMAPRNTDREALVRVALLDITAQRSAEQQVRRHLEEAAQMQRQQTVNELATLVAHELNQPLGAIAMFADTNLKLLENFSAHEATMAENLQRIKKSAMLGGEIIRRLRTFLGRSPIEMMPLDLNATIKTVCALLESKLKDEGVRIDFDLCQALPPMMGLSVYLEQVLLNLLLNALEAIQENDMTDGCIQIQTQRGEGMVHICIRDNGPGVSPEAAAKLFDTLYSTKKMGLGVGLGISRSLMEMHHGRLWVEPQQPGGIFHCEVPFAS